MESSGGNRPPPMRPGGPLPPRPSAPSSGAAPPGAAAAPAPVPPGSLRIRALSADDASYDAPVERADTPTADRRAALRRQYDRRRRDRDGEDRENRRRRRSAEGEGGRRGDAFRRREADRMRAFGRDQRLTGGGGGGGPSAGGTAGAGAGAAGPAGPRAGEGTPLLPPRHDGRRRGAYGDDGRRRRVEDRRDNYSEEDDDDERGGGGWDSDADGTGGGTGGGGGGGGGSVRSRTTVQTYTSSRALALPGIFQNLARCVVPSEHEVVDGLYSSSCSSEEDSASGEEEDWEGMDESEIEDEYGDDDEGGGGEYELSPREERERGEEDEDRMRAGPVGPVRSNAQPLTAEEVESAYADAAAGSVDPSPHLARVAKTVRRIDPDDFGRRRMPSRIHSDGVPAHISTPAKRKKNLSDPLPRILPRHHRNRHRGQYSDDHHHRHGHGHHRHHRRYKRSFRRRVFLLLTEPQTSIASAAFFIVLIVAIALSNILMMLQTMDFFQFTPPDCFICGGTNEYYSTNDDTNYFGPTYQDAPIPCECPPVPNPGIVWLEDVIIWFFTVEWILRVVCYEPARAPSSERPSGRAALVEWMSYLTETTTVLDALAIFPYYLERYEETNGLLSLRLLRLFRVFQLVRLGQYNVTFLCLINVLVQAILSLNLLIIVLVFGAAFFGSMIYWLEKGEWKYTEVTDPPSFSYVRVGVDGVTEEVSPFTSIPASFWWFIVTATTVGYGDTYPTSTGGKCVAALAMLMGVLVIAFPVSVFSDLWSKELSKAGVLRELDEGGSKGGDGGGTERTNAEESGREAKEGKAGAEFKVPKEVGGGALNGTSKTVGADGPLSQEDVQAIITHLRNIDESQEKIRNILRKCQLRE